MFWHMRSAAKPDIRNFIRPRSAHSITSTVPKPLRSRPSRSSTLRTPFRFEVSGGTTYEVGLPSGTVDESAMQNIIAWLVQTQTFDIQTQTFDVEPSTTYSLVGIAYDQEGRYSRPTLHTFTSQAIMPGEDSPQYRRFIGNWSMDYETESGWSIRK